jgi:hypothetical protein
MELKTSSRGTGSKSTVMQYDEEMLEGLIDEYGDSVDPGCTSPEKKALSQSPGKTVSLSHKKA